MTLHLPRLCMLSVNSIIGLWALWNVPIHNEDFHTYSIHCRWDKNRKHKGPCTDSVRFTQLWSKHSQFSGEGVGGCSPRKLLNFRRCSKNGWKCIHKIITILYSSVPTPLYNYIVTTDCNSRKAGTSLYWRRQKW